jgi:hypothetical protein
MAVYFTVASPFNFSNYQYMFVFNTTGSGITPSTDTIQKNWAGYSYALMALGSGGIAYARPVRFVFSPSHPQAPPAWYFLGTTPQQFSFNSNSNGSGTEFSMLFQQSIFAPYDDMWTFNAFVTQASSDGPWTFLDSMGAGGPIDPQFNSPSLCVKQPFDVFKYAIDTNVPDPSAQIVSVEIANNPVRPTSCP